MKPNSNNVTDRLASSPTRDNDVTSTDWPVITQSVYTEIHRKAGEIDPALRSLCVGRNKIGQALLAIDSALTHYQPRPRIDHPRRPENKPVYNKLVKIRKELEKLQVSYPLQVVK